MIFQFALKVKEANNVKVTVLTHTPDPEKTVAAAARLCYSRIGAMEIMENLTDEKVASFIQKLINSGHMSPLEHVSFTFAVEGVSRTLLAQLTRHRIASYSVQSLRYNNPFEEELSNQDEVQTTCLKAQNRAYLQGFASSGKYIALVGGDIKEDDLEEIRKNPPDKINREYPGHYLRGLFDADGKITDDGFSLSFPEKFYSILSQTPFEFEQKGESLVLSGKKAVDFCLFIYNGLDFVRSLYSREKLANLCKRAPEFFSKIKTQARDYIAQRYYCVLPAEIEKNLDAILTYIAALENCKKAYLDMVKMGVDKEDARYILPMGTCTNLVVTMNARSLYNFFNLRCCERAQSEIRQLARMMLDEVRKIAPNLFKKAGAPCEATGYCPEGAFSCGKYPVRN